MDDAGPARLVVSTALLVLLAAALELAAGIGIAYVAGWSRVASVVRSISWPWLLVVAGALVVSCIGYYFAYRGVYQIDEGPRLSARELRAVVTAGFGGFLFHGGSSLDGWVLRGAGSDDRDASVRVTALAGFEHGVLSLIGTAAAIDVLVRGLAAPPADFTVPWAVIPVPGFLVAFWCSARFAGRCRPATHGLRKFLGIFLDAIGLVRGLFFDVRRYWWSVVGMLVFWLADFLAGWAGLAAFGDQMYWSAFVVGFGTGMLFTRRTGPLAGAGVLVLTLTATVWASGAPLAVAAAGVFCYRVLSLWLPMPFALASLGTIRGIGRRRGGSEAGEPALS